MLCSVRIRELLGNDGFPQRPIDGLQKLLGFSAHPTQGHDIAKGKERHQDSKESLVKRGQKAHLLFFH